MCACEPPKSQRIVLRLVDMRAAEVTVHVIASAKTLAALQLLGSGTLHVGWNFSLPQARTMGECNANDLHKFDCDGHFGFYGRQNNRL
jgi:hypothetical protein